MLTVWVPEAPSHGDANRAVLREVAHWLRVPRSSVALLGGAASRIKTVLVEGIAQLPAPDSDRLRDNPWDQLPQDRPSGGDHDPRT